MKNTNTYKLPIKSETISSTWPTDFTWSLDNSTTSTTIDSVATQKCFSTWTGDTTNYPSTNYPSTTSAYYKYMEDFINVAKKKKIKPTKRFAVHQEIGELLGSSCYSNDACLIGYIQNAPVQILANEKMSKLVFTINSQTYTEVSLQDPN